jgi:hypothetical protein
MTESLNQRCVALAGAIADTYQAKADVIRRDSQESARTEFLDCEASRMRAKAEDWKRFPIPFQTTS